MSNSEILQGSISVTTIIIARSRVQFASLQQPEMVSFTRIFYPVCCNRQQINQNTANSSQRSKHHSILQQSCSRGHVGFRDMSTSGPSGIHFCHAAQKLTYIKLKSPSLCQSMLASLGFIGFFNDRFALRPDPAASCVALFRLIIQ